MHHAKNENKSQPSIINNEWIEKYICLKLRCDEIFISNITISLNQ